jgi:hypothetical protein
VSDKEAKSRLERRGSVLALESEPIGASSGRFPDDQCRDTDQYSWIVAFLNHRSGGYILVNDAIDEALPEHERCDRGYKHTPES